MYFQGFFSISSFVIALIADEGTCIGIPAVAISQNAIKGVVETYRSLHIKALVYWQWYFVHDINPHKQGRSCQISQSHT